MNNELVKIDFTQEQVNLIKTQIAPKANDNELKLFLYQARRTGLDPLARQIYAIHRWNSQQGKEVMTIQTSIDGFRVIAERSGDYAGQDEPLFEHLNLDDNPIKCKITVYRFRNDIRYPAAVGIAYWREYVQTDKQGNPSGLWKKMPHVMLAKVAEALALRKAYPQDLSGLYTSEEMQQAEVPKEEIYQEVEEQHEMIIPISDFERDDLFNLLNTSTYEGKIKDKLFSKINSLSTREDYDKAKQNLLANQLGIDGAVNPSQSEISRHIRKISQPA